MTKIYAFVNQKGGVGKTTTTISLASCFARMGQRVLMVDLDPQANATSCLGVDKRRVQSGTYEVLIGSCPPLASILKNEQLGLSLIPSTQDLTGAEVELISEERREVRLRDALREIHAEYDYILIDSPPSLGILTLNALVAAADGAVIPVQCEYLALEGLSQLTQTIGRVRASFHPRLEIRGVVMTMFDGRTNLGNQVIDEVRRHFPGKVFASVIPRSIRLAEAPSHGIPISIYAPSSIGALAYQELAEEILKSDGARIHDKG
ncbi:MAG: ParA family protein [Anaerolineales bacterium]|nr:ParA family protein [Anaerolineales bacterium]